MTTKKAKFEVGVLLGFMIIITPAFLGHPNGLISTSIIGFFISTISSAYLGSIKFKETLVVPVLIPKPLEAINLP